MREEEKNCCLAKKIAKCKSWSDLNRSGKKIQYERSKEKLILSFTNGNNDRKAESPALANKRWVQIIDGRATAHHFCRFAWGKRARFLPIVFLLWRGAIVIVQCSMGA